jgi:hypothetical protein
MGRPRRLGQARKRLFDGGNFLAQFVDASLGTMTGKCVELFLR